MPTWKVKGDFQRRLQLPSRERNRKDEKMWRELRKTLSPYNTLNLCELVRGLTVCLSTPLGMSGTCHVPFLALGTRYKNATFVDVWQIVGMIWVRHPFTLVRKYNGQGGNQRWSIFSISQQFYSKRIYSVSVMMNLRLKVSLIENQTSQNFNLFNNALSRTHTFLFTFITLDIILVHTCWIPRRINFTVE